MGRFLLRRIALMIPTMLGLVLLTFIVSKVVPADPAKLAAGPRATAAMVEQIRQEWGLDQPLYIQFVKYLGNLLQGDWGRSIVSQRPVLDDVRLYFPATLELVIASEVLAIVIGIPLGVIAAVKVNRWPDQLVRIFAVSAGSLPRFWFAILLQLTVAVGLGLLPLNGRLPPLALPPDRVTGMYTIDSLLAGDFEMFWTALRHLALPTFVQAVGSMAIVVRTVRGDVLEAINRDYVRTARAKGLSELKILRSHVLRNAFIPTLTMIGLSFGFSIGGSVLVETIFDWPGIGLYAVTAVSNLDFEPVMGVTILTGVLFIVINLIVDLLYGVLDPRIRFD